jgi:hypothetical protein
MFLRTRLYALGRFVYPEFMAATKKKKSTLVDVAKIGSLGGQARAKNLTKSELSDAGRKAVQARWAKAKKKAAGK